MHDDIRRLRLQVRSFRRDRSPRATRYSKAFQVQAIAAARKRLAEGIVVAQVARELGLTTQTLTRWLGSSSRPALRPVRIVAGPRPVVHAPTNLVLVAFGGIRVEGLDMDGVIQILRSLA